MYKKKFIWKFEAEFPSVKLPVISLLATQRPTRRPDRSFKMRLNADALPEEYYDLFGNIFKTPTFGLSNWVHDWNVGQGKLSFYDGMDGLIERWYINDMSIKTIHWASLDYSSSDVTEIEINWTFDSAQMLSLLKE